MRKENSIIIRKITLDDIDKLIDLRLQLVKENPKTFGVVYESAKRYDSIYYKKWLEDYIGDDCGMFFLELDGNPIGMCAIRREDIKDPNIGYFGSLGVLKIYQGKGYGKLLEDFRMNWVSKNTKFKKIRGIIEKSNTKRIQMALKYGFEIIGEGSYYGVLEVHIEKDLN